MTIERVRAVIDAATPGPWDPAIALADGMVPENARAIVLAHDLMPELLALWEAALGMAGFLRDESDPWCFICGEHMEQPHAKDCTATPLDAALAALDAKTKEVLG